MINRSHLVQLHTTASRKSAATYGTKGIFYIITFSETNTKTWVRENVRETESHPLYNVTAR